MKTKLLLSALLCASTFGLDEVLEKLQEGCGK